MSAANGGADPRPRGRARGIDHRATKDQDVSFGGGARGNPTIERTFRLDDSGWLRQGLRRKRQRGWGLSYRCCRSFSHISTILDFRSAVSFSYAASDASNSGGGEIRGPKTIFLRAVLWKKIVPL